MSALLTRLTDWLVSLPTLAAVLYAHLLLQLGVTGLGVESGALLAYAFAWRHLEIQKNIALVICEAGAS